MKSHGMKNHTLIRENILTWWISNHSVDGAVGCLNYNQDLYPKKEITIKIYWLYLLFNLNLIITFYIKKKKIKNESPKANNFFLCRRKKKLGGPQLSDP